ncbi:leucine rich repeat domain-containing protein [Hirsutella rhossiliensis]|uniref:Leucine rich repeat domain-containing protein n=1 Tax=Hirsutella rhossiliensis TaxID=111463 RepID=A0A9P8SGB9_9HYPO|nr:leucine rich repeat domain-containing protein [Hirsutella rhossiliensis]KAH0961863.1 leucine rich repeat domain-containing protein [Hirsutella rhossiliensis]
MAEEPSLPRLPAVSWDEPSQRFSNNPRKRNLPSAKASSPSLNSSDPAVFSSDDDPGLDNYVEGRKKKRYIGSWFQQQPASSDSAFGDAMPAPKPAKRRLARQVDSGVFLGSDGTDNEDMMEALNVPVRARLPQLDKRPAPQVSPAELAARETVRRCLEQGLETIDFWYLGLEELSDETISPLANFSCIPLVTKDVAFEQKVPELKLYLAMNSLRRAPGALFDLTHLTILSLRGNKLTELPPAISKLSNLKELNISQNRLTSLPAELLDLLQPRSNLRELVMHPNPFDEPDKPIAGFTREGNGPGDGSQFYIKYLGRSPLQVSDSRGKAVSDFKLPSGDTAQKVAVERPGGVPNMSAARPSRVPSLVEASLRSCYGSSQLSELQHYMPEGLSHLRRLLGRAAQQRDMGGICDRTVIIESVASY